MFPLIVAIIGSAASPLKAAEHLKKRFTRRGFQVRVLEAASEEFLKGSDVVIVPFQTKDLEQLAQQLESRWTEQWLTWYAASRHLVPPR
ncbi:MAG: hypothetical protein HY211_07405 [Candidatus Omnitrophica bacterium]|nr:hypothetical protein [Candidatus Omnitrophota bacterium]